MKGTRECGMCFMDRDNAPRERLKSVQHKDHRMGMGGSMRWRWCALCVGRAVMTTQGHAEITVGEGGSPGLVAATNGR